MIVALFLLFGRGDKIPIVSGIVNPAPDVPTFAFDSVTPKYEAMVAHTKKTKLEQSAKQAAPGVQDVVQQWLQAGYVDPSTWDDTGEIEDLFTSEAKQQLEANASTLVLGPDAGVTIATPDKSKIKVTALVDGNLTATRAMADVWFNETTQNDDGTYSEIHVTGTVFLVPDGDTWRIEAYGLQRSVEDAQPPKSSTAPSPTES